MGILAGTWLSVALVTLTGRPGATSDALGLLLLVASVAMLVPASAALQGKLVPAAVLCTTVASVPPDRTLSAHRVRSLG